MGLCDATRDWASERDLWQLRAYSSDCALPQMRIEPRKVDAWTEDGHPREITGMLTVERGEIKKGPTQGAENTRGENREVRVWSRY